MTSRKLEETLVYIYIYIYTYIYVQSSFVKNWLLSKRLFFRNLMMRLADRNLAADSNLAINPNALRSF